MPKILVVIARLNVGGTARYIEELYSGLVSEDYEVLVATGYVQGSEIEDSIVERVNLHRIKSLGREISLVRDLKATLELRSLIKTFQPDIIYSHTFKAGALVRLLKQKVPVVHAFHGHLLDEPELSAFKIKAVVAIEKFLASKTTKFVTVGRRVGDELAEVGIKLGEKFISIPPGVRPLVLNDKRATKERLGILDDQRVVIGWLARVVPVKGPLRVVELAKRFPDALFLLAGGGSMHEEIQKVAPDNLKVLGWQDASDLWAVSDIAISTSDNEGMPVTLIEAQLSGIPVVALDAGSLSEVVLHNESGFVITEFDDEYFEALRKLIDDPNLQIKFGAAAQSRARKIFSPEILVSKHLELFSSLKEKV